MIFNYLLSIIIVSIVALASTTALLKDGDIYRIASVADGNVLTVGGKAGLSGSNVTAEPWQDGGNQKWLAVETAPSSDRFILIPKWQSWNWNDFAKNSTKGQREHLPDFTIALAVDPKSGLLSDQGFTGKSGQQWRTVEGTDKTVTVKSDDDKCMTNPGEQVVKTKSKSKLLGFLKKQHKKIVPGTIRTSNCDTANNQQLWRVEAVV